ncbi:MAG: fused MFS/spermidine synthase [Propionibacteriaceae bacterium]|nr:fused MFS/spermidine synthase [Propionibacteriaceae bacterium]
MDPERPDSLAFEYVQHIAGVLECTLLERPAAERVRVVHVGGGGLTLPRWVEWKRPHTAQIVLEPDAALVAEVRRKLPLARRSGIKIRETDGLAGLAAMGDAYADCVVVDAFDGGRVPAELATAEWFAEVARVLRPGGLVVMNLIDSAPFAWSRRCLAGLAAHFRHLVLGAEPAVFKGRRFGNLVATGSSVPLPVRAIARRCAASAFPYRLLNHKELVGWRAGAPPFGEADAQRSPALVGKHFWFS